MNYLCDIQREKLPSWKMTSNYSQHIYPHLVNSQIIESEHHQLRKLLHIYIDKNFSVIIQFFPRDNSKLSVLLLLWKMKFFLSLSIVCIRCDSNVILIAILRYWQHFFLSPLALMAEMSVCVIKNVWYRIMMICNRNEKGRE